MPDLKRAIADANALLDLCEALSFEGSLKPLHQVHLAAVGDSLQEGLFTLFATWGYVRLGEARLELTSITDWRAELASTAFFWTGPWTTFATGQQSLTVEGRTPRETPDHQALRILFNESLARFVPPEAQAFKLASADSLGNDIEPRIALRGPYFVLAWEGHAIVVGFCWDS